MYLFESLNQLIQTYLPEDQIKRLRQAYLVARDAHEGQTRSSGEPYITHPVAVACILAEMKLDYETLMAALLHDVIEDTPATYQDMEQLFGKSVAELVEGVSKLDKLKFRDKKEAQAEKLSQDDYGDGAGYPRHPHQTCRPYPQHAHAGLTSPGQTSPHRP